MFRIDEESRPAAGVVLSIHGELDVRIASELQDRIAAAIEDGDGSLVLDLSGVTFIDSMALGVLLRAARVLQLRGGRLHLVVPGPELRRIFEITLLDQVFAIDSTRDEALQRLVNSKIA